VPRTEADRPSRGDASDARDCLPVGARTPEGRQGGTSALEAAERVVARSDGCSLYMYAMAHAHMGNVGSCSHKGSGIS